MLIERCIRAADSTMSWECEEGFEERLPML
jgi:hypothetical protein